MITISVDFAILIASIVGIFCSALWGIASYCGYRRGVDDGTAVTLRRVRGGRPLP